MKPELSLFVIRNSFNRVSHSWTVIYPLVYACILVLGWPQPVKGEAPLSQPTGKTDGDTNSPTVDKSHYHLFRPTPDALMREMVTDRPDKTESPYTVDAGHFQVEMDFLTYSQDRDTSNGGDTRVISHSVAPINLKAGLFNNVDFQLILETWNRVKTEDRIAGATVRQSGFGDITPRLKLNLWGNDGGPTAMGVIPFVKIPTSQDNLGNDAVEGGFIVPFAVELPKGFSLGLMTEFDFMRDGTDQKYHPEFINSITLGHDLIGKLEGYVEFFSQVSAETGAKWIGTVDLGLTYAITPNIRFDLGVNIGVTRAADDLNPFAGISFRF